jgi:hypothetical protein
MSMSWHSIAVQGQGLATRSALIMFGLPQNDTLVVAIWDVPGLVAVNEQVVVSGIAAADRDDKNITVWMLIDGDICRLAQVATGVGILEFEFPIVPASQGVGLGAHKFSFFAVGTGANVSPQESFNISVLPPATETPTETKTPSETKTPTPTSSVAQSPTRTISETPNPTKSASPRPTASQSQFPAPTLPPGPALPISVVCDVGENFDIRSGDMGTTYSGWNTELRAPNFFGQISTGRASGCQNVTVNNVLLTTNFTKLSENCVLVTFRLENKGTWSPWLSIGVSARVAFDGDERAPIAAAAGGLVVYSMMNVMTVSVRGLPLVNDASSVWFGPAENLPSGAYTNATEPDFHGAESAFAFSWIGMTLAAGERLSRSALVKLGAPNLSNLSLLLFTQGLPTEMAIWDTVECSGRLEALVEDPDCWLFVVVDSDTGVVYRRKQVPANGLTFSFQFSPADYTVSPGQSHTFIFCAVDSVGTVSNAQSFTCRVLPVPTVSVTPKPSVTRSPPPAPTYPPAAPALPINVLCSVADANFDLTGGEGTSVVSVTTHGFSTRLRVGDAVSNSSLQCGSTSVSVPWPWPVTHTLTTNITKISPNAVLLNFQATNGNFIPVTVRIEVNAGLRFDGDEFARVRRNENGFVVYSDSNALTFVVKGSPLVDDVSTFWFGEDAAMASAWWNQTDAEYIAGVDSAVAFSWQRGPGPASWRTAVFAIIKFGLPGTNQLSISLIEPPLVVFLGGSASITANVTSAVVGERVTIYMVLDNNISVLYAVASDAPTNSNFTFEVTTLPTTPGYHPFAFYAVDSVGTVSAAGSFTPTLQWPPRTSSRSRSPTRTRSPTTTQTPTRSLPGETPLATETPPSPSLSPTETQSSRAQTSVRTATAVPATPAATAPTTLVATVPGTALAQTRTATKVLRTPPASVEWPPDDETDAAGTAKRIGVGAIAATVIGLVVVIAIIVTILICRKRANPRDHHSLDAELADREIFDEVDEFGKADFDL